MMRDIFFGTTALLHGQRSKTKLAERRALKCGLKCGLNRGVTRAFVRARGEEGSQLIELALVLPMLFAVFVGAVDFGRAYFVSMEVTSAAEAGAMYGITNPADTAGMQTAAMSNAPDLPGLTPTATYGTECADGSSPASANNTPPSSCPTGVVQFVEVDTTASYQPILYYPGFQSAFTLTSKSRMRASF
jgi:Flp pilus assembly protein TadG